MKNVKQQVNNLHVRMENEQPLSTPVGMHGELQAAKQRIQQLEQENQVLRKENQEQMGQMIKMLQRIDDKTTHSRQDEKRMLDSQHESKSSFDFIKEKVTALGSSVEFIKKKVTALKPAVAFIKKNTTQTWFARVSGTLLGFTIIGILFFSFRRY